MVRLKLPRRGSPSRKRPGARSADAESTDAAQTPLLADDGRKGPATGRKASGDVNGDGKVDYHDAVTAVRQVKHNVVSATTAGVSRAACLTDKALTKAERAIDAATTHADERLKQQAFSKVLDMTKRMIDDAVHPPGMPTCLERIVDPIVERVWPDVRHLMLEQLLDKYSKQHAAYREMLVKYWAPRPSCWPPHRYLRARYLFAIKPATQTLFLQLRDPLALFIFLLKLNPFYGTSVLLFTLTFLLIDKRDEFQLVQFILDFKQFQAVGAFVVCAKIGLFSVVCVLQEHAQQHLQVEDHVCLDAAPGTTFKARFEVCLEGWRVVLMFAACLWLSCGCARGGMEELRALEAVRLDVADGELDGEVQTRALRSGAASKVGQSHAQKGSDGSPTKAELEAARAREVERQHAHVRTGGYLAYFVFFDLIALFLLSLLACTTLWTYSLKRDDDAYWVCLYFLKIEYALASFPFLIFAMPVLGPALHGAKATGYDRTGLLAPKLSNQSIRAKLRHEKEAALDMENVQAQYEAYVAKYGGGAEAEARAAEQVQRMARGRAARRQVASHLLYIGTCGMMTKDQTLAMAEKIDRHGRVAAHDAKNKGHCAAHQAKHHVQAARIARSPEKRSTDDGGGLSC